MKENVKPMSLFKPVCVLHEYINSYISDNMNKISITQEEYITINNSGSRAQLLQTLNTIREEAVILAEESLNYFLKDSSLCLKLTNGDYYVPTGDSYNNIISFSNNINFNIQIQGMNNGFRCVVDRNRTLNFIYYPLSIIDNKVIIDNEISQSMSGEIPFRFLTVYRYELSNNVYINNLKSKSLEFENQIIEHKKKIEEINEKKQKIDYLISFMKDNDIKSESIPLLKSKMIINMFDKEENKESILTELNDIIELEIN